MAGEEGNRPACAACKHQRKKCRGDTCVLRRHFPATMKEDFQAVNRVFGIANISKIIKSLDPVQQDIAVKSLLWEAKLWKEDPVHGPLGLFNRLQRELLFLKEKINMLQPRPLIPAPPPPRPETYQSLRGGVGNFSFHPNYTGQYRTSNGHELQQIIQPNFGRTGFNHQNTRNMVNPRPVQQYLPLPYPLPYHNSFGHNKENELVPYANNAGISGQDRRSVIHVGDRTSNVVRPSRLPAGPAMSSNRSSVTVKPGDEDETGNDEARELVAALYYDHQLLNSTNQNNVQGKLT
nr:LOB domain-containing protein 6-like [Ipomoea batatas]